MKVIIATICSSSLALAVAFCMSKIFNIHGWSAGYIIGTIQQFTYWSLLWVWGYFDD